MAIPRRMTRKAVSIRGSTSTVTKTTLISSIRFVLSLKLSYVYFVFSIIKSKVLCYLRWFYGECLVVEVLFISVIRNKECVFRLSLTVHFLSFLEYVLETHFFTFSLFSEKFPLCSF